MDEWAEQDLYSDPTSLLVERGVDPDTAGMAEGGDRWVLLVDQIVVTDMCLRFYWLCLHDDRLEEGVENCYQTAAWRVLLLSVALEEPGLEESFQDGGIQDHPLGENRVWD